MFTAIKEVDYPYPYCTLLVNKGEDKKGWFLVRNSVVILHCELGTGELGL